MPVSRHTLLRQLKQAARHSASPTVRVLGVDDWAWKKGMSFGTILVDLERNEVVDVLPTRSAEVLSLWLSQHPGVEILGRDRQGEYAEGARQGAPDAVQVADRFHLQLNLRQTVERALAVQRQHLGLPASSVALPATSRPALAEEAPQDRWMPVRSRVCQQEAEAAWQRRQQQLELFETVAGDESRGTVRQIAAHLGVNRRRLDRWLRLDALPERHRMEPRGPGWQSPSATTCGSVGRLGSGTAVRCSPRSKSSAIAVATLIWPSYFPLGVSLRRRTPHHRSRRNQRRPCRHCRSVDRSRPKWQRR